MKPNRKTNFIYKPFNISVAADKAEWERLLSDGTNLSAFQEGDRIFDTYTRLCLELRQTPSGELEWYAVNGTVGRYTVEADVVACRWGKPNFAPTWKTCDTTGEAGFGIFLNSAVTGKRAYAMHQGRYLNRVSPSPPGIVTLTSTTNQGEATTIGGLGQFYMGFSMDQITINAEDFYLVTVSLPVLVS